MRLRSVVRSVELVAVVVGVGAFLVVTPAGCGVDQGAGRGPAAGQGEQIVTKQPIPPMDANPPSDFQTATFAFG